MFLILLSNILFRRFDSLERMMDEKMKMLFDFANSVGVSREKRSSTISSMHPEGSNQR